MTLYFNWRYKIAGDNPEDINPRYLTHRDAMPETSRQWFTAYDPALEGQYWDYSYQEGNWPVLAERDAPSVADQCQTACDAIDQTYAQVIEAINPVSKQLEHQLAYVEAVAYLSASDEGNENDENNESATDYLDAHVNVYNVSTKEAAQLIKIKGDSANTQLLVARTLRLAGKKAIYDAIEMDSSADLNAVITPFIKQLGALVNANT